MKIIRDQRNQDLSWFIDMYEAGRLELNPPYQRKSVWGGKDKKFFLDTIFNNFPCPAIYLQKEITDTKVVFNVVDGKQRLQTVIDFYKNKLRIAADFGDPLLAGKRWKDIETISDLKYKFFNYTFSVEQLHCETEVQWDEVFNRVNKNQKTLKDQELRHARFNGWLITFAEDEADNNFWQLLKISTRGRSKRMQDVEFVSILMLVILENDFVGFPQARIDELYLKYDFSNEEDLPEDESEIEEEDKASGVTVLRSTVEQFKEHFPKTKDIIEQVLTAEPLLLNHISKKPLTHTYTLWTVVCFNLQKTYNIPEFASQYLDLFNRCAQFKEADEALTGEPDDKTKAAFKYFKHTSGAATEKEPRKNRHDAVLEFLGWI